MKTFNLNTVSSYQDIDESLLKSFISKLFFLSPSSRLCAHFHGYPPKQELTFSLPHLSLDRLFVLMYEAAVENDCWDSPRNDDLLFIKPVYELVDIELSFIEEINAEHHSYIDMFIDDCIPEYDSQTIRSYTLCNLTFWADNIYDVWRITQSHFDEQGEDCLSSYYNFWHEFYMYNNDDLPF